MCSRPSENVPRPPSPQGPRPKNSSPDQSEGGDNPREQHSCLLCFKSVPQNLPHGRSRWEGMTLPSNHLFFFFLSLLPALYICFLYHEQVIPVVRAIHACTNFGASAPLPISMGEFSPITSTSGLPIFVTNSIGPNACHIIITRLVRGLHQQNSPGHHR